MTLEHPIVIISIDEYEKLKASYDRDRELINTVHDALSQMTESMSMCQGPVWDEFLKAQSIFLARIEELKS